MNRHGLNGREILSLLCLPIPPPGQGGLSQGLPTAIASLLAFPDSGRTISHLAMQSLPCQSEIGGAGRNRTGVHGVAVRCMTTLPPRLFVTFVLHRGCTPVRHNRHSLIRHRRWSCSPLHDHSATAPIRHFCSKTRTATMSLSRWERVRVREATGLTEYPHPNLLPIGEGAFW